MASGIRLAELIDALERGLIDRQQLPIVVPSLGAHGLQSVEWTHWFVVLAEAALMGRYQRT